MTVFGRLKRGVLYLLIGMFGVAGIASILVLFRFWLFLALPANAARGSLQVDIQPGMGAVAIGRLLSSKGVVGSARGFYLLCRIRRIGNKLRAGEYVFSSLSTPRQILDQIVNGRVIIHRVTLPEGSTVRDVAKAIERQGLGTEKEIIRLAQDKAFINTLGLQAPSLEGYLFPETYHFQRNQDGHAILKTMVHTFRLHFSEMWKKKASETGLSIQNVVIMASIVEKEAMVDSERPIIAAVFFNRLRLDMPLQSDPTAIYDLPGFYGTITWSHLKRQSPYNTYFVKGLPAGPICNPGAKSLKAVLYPEKVRYLYFVSNNDGTHHFSETIEEHRQAVARYREKRKGGIGESVNR